MGALGAEAGGSAGGAERVETFSEVGSVEAAPGGEAAWAWVSVEKFRVPPSEHPDILYDKHQVFLPLRGVFAQGHRSTVGFRTDAAGVGDVSIVPALTAHRGRSETGGEFASVFLDPALLARAADVERRSERADLLPRFGAQDPVVRQIAGLLVAEAAAGGGTGRLYAESLAAHLTGSYSGADSRPSGEERLGGLPASALKGTTDYVGDHLAEDLRLEDLAREANLSPYHFARLFKLSTGLSPHQYVIERRVEEAKVLLRGTDLTVGEIALAVGFVNQSHFARQFKRLTGATPSAFR